MRRFVVVPIVCQGVLLWMSIAGASADVPESAERAREEQQAYRDYALKQAGNAQAGERLFRQHERLACGNCHVVTGAEKSGPNLDGIGDKYSREELIRHVLEPNVFIQPGYEQVTIATQNGRVVTGRIVRATKLSYRLLDAMGKRIDIARDQIEKMKASTTSMMPENLTASVSREEFADLIAYLQTLRRQVLTGFRAPNEPVEIPRLEAPVTFSPIHPAELKFENPVWCGAIPGTDGQLVVVEHQEARVWRLDRSQAEVRKELFADLSAEVSIGANQGLMCLTFHPQYAENRRYFLEHEVSEQGVVKTTVVERRASADGLRDSGTPSRRLLELEQPAFNHNGGCIAFGKDGFLYAAFGDGGPQRDPNGYSQNPRIFHGSMLRIDVDGQQDGLPYAIPPDNPFLAQHAADQSIRPETWAIGFREPWRFSFDAETGDLWVGDVGQDQWEEVAIVRRGENHGWNVFEGFEPFSEEYRRDGETYARPLLCIPTPSVYR